MRRRDLGLLRGGCLCSGIFCGWGRCRLLLAIKLLSSVGGWASLRIPIRGWVEIPSLRKFDVD